MSRSIRVNPRYDSLQAGRGIAALMVVCWHALVYVGNDPRYWRLTWVPFRAAGLVFGVEYFFVLSGVVIMLAHLKDIGRPEMTRTYLWKRLKRVYPVYWIFLLAVVLEYALRPALGASYQRSAWVILSGFFLVHVHSLEVNLPVAWTLFHEVLFYLVFVGLILFKKAGYWIASAWMLMSVVALIFPLPAYWGEYLASPLHLLFGLGIAVAIGLRRDVRSLTLPACLVGFLTLAYAFFWAGTHGYTSVPIQLVAGAGSALIIFGMASLESTGSLTVPGWLNVLGDASYSLYLIHYPAMMAIASALYKMSLHWKHPIVPSFLILVGSSTALGIMTHFYIEVPLLRYLLRFGPRQPAKLPLRVALSHASPTALPE